jgi:hypothetical protein
MAYLHDLGVNAIEVMPLSNVGASVDWGYLPIGYFGVDERMGKRSDFQALVDVACALYALCNPPHPGRYPEPTPASCNLALNLSAILAKPTSVPWISSAQSEVLASVPRTSTR